MGLLSLFKTKPGAPEEAVAAGAARKKADEASRIWRKAEFAYFAAGEDLHMVTVRGGLPKALPSFAVDFLLGCEEFLTLEEHVAEHAERQHWSGLQVDSLVRLLPEIATAGLLISPEDLRALCARSLDPGNAPPLVKVIGFPTGGNRTAMLERCVSSFAKNLRAHGRAADFVVADSSGLSEQRAAFRGLLGLLSREHALPMRYCGEEEKRRFAGAVVERSGCRPESIEFALFDPLQAGFACGANRNALMLHEAGRVLVTVDDDVICEMAPMPPSEKRLSIFSGKDPCWRDFFTDRAGALAAAKFEEIDFLAAHEKLLGRDVGALFPPDLGLSEVDLEHVDDAVLLRLTGERARVATTYFGQVGDPGTPTSCYYFFAREKNRERLTRTEAEYRAAFSSRSVLSGVQAPSIGGGFMAPGMTIGMDFRELLPPFFPVLHAEDMVFGAAAWLCCTGSFSGHVPLALHHDSGPSKKIHTPSDLTPENGATVFEFATIVRAILLRCAPPLHADCAARIRALGRNLSAFAAMPPRDFREAFGAVVLAVETQELTFLEERLREEIDPPDYWRRDIERFIEHTREALQRENFDIPFELKNQRSDEANRTLMRRLLARYGALLEDWPAIVAAARELRESGVELSVAM